MTWHEVDFLKHEARYFGDDLENWVLKIHKYAYEQLEQVHKKNAAEIEELAAKAKDESEFEDLGQYAGWEEDRFQQDLEALGTMTLALMARLVDTFLRKAKGYFDKTHPAEKRYKGDGELERRITECAVRFGINIETLPHFDTLREVILARNCCLHAEGQTSDDYLKQTPMRLLVGAGDRVNINAEQVKQFVGELRKFAEALVAELAKVRSHYRSGQNQPQKNPT